MKLVSKSQLSLVAPKSGPAQVYGYFRNDKGTFILTFQFKSFTNPSGIGGGFRKYTAITQLSETEAAKIEGLTNGTSFLNTEDYYSASRHFPEVEGEVVIESTESLIGDNPDHLLKKMNNETVQTTIDGVRYDVFRYTELVIESICNDVTQADIKRSFHTAEPIRCHTRGHAHLNGYTDMCTKEVIEELDRQAVEV